ncbi:MAG: ATP phosphoribosyltransferase regulatory subunit [Methylophagaceae bacterium]
MSLKQRWMLPEGIDELMPEQAARLELLRRKLIDRMQSWGYKLVFPPLVEYLDSLLTGTGKALDIQTFKLTDQMSGRLMGIRADMTPQLARIAAHNLRDHEGVLRLCYIGNVLHALPKGQGTSRNPIQLGAEIYGHSGPESDMEIVQLMIEMLAATDLDNDLLLDIGHVGIYRGLANHAGLTDVQEQELFAALQRKEILQIQTLLTEYQLSAESHTMLLALAELHGGVEILEQAKLVLSKAPEAVHQALVTLQAMANLMAQRLPNVAINFDLAELRGYHYHTGVVFAAYQAGSAQAIALGGRYNDIGSDFGHAQPATGFSLDLKAIARQMPTEDEEQDTITVEWSDDEAQQQKIEQLRSQGQTIVYELPK